MHTNLWRFGLGSTLIRRLLAALAVALSLLPFSAKADYRIDTGDTIEISVVGMPDLRQRAKVNLDGEVSLPLLGQIKVVGLTLAELRITMQKLVPTKFFRRTEGQGALRVLDPDDIVVDIVDYRPVYVNGDVTKPGELAYRPDLTVLQAIALAGGIDIMHFRMDNPFLGAADLRSEYNSLWMEFVREQAHVLRLQAQLDGKKNFDRSELVKAPIPAYIVSRIADLEANQLTTRSANDEKEKASVQQSLQETDRQLALLTEQQQKEQGETNVGAADMQRLRGLAKQGLLTVTRATDERRSVLLAATRLLQTGVQLTQVRRDHSELQSKLQKVDDQRKLELLGELEDAEVKLAKLLSRLQAVGEKVLYTDAVRSQLVRGIGGDKPKITIVRKGEKGRTRVAADEDTELMPGDVVEVALKIDTDPAAVTR